MPDIRKCSIYGCRSNSRDCKDLKFFNFPPRDNPIFNAWLSSCHSSADRLQSIRKPLICQKHFEPRFVGFRRLFIGAIPTLLLEAPPGFAEEELAKANKETAEQREKERLLNLTSQSLLEWVQRAEYHPEIGKTLCTSRRELIRVATEIRNLLGATLKFTIDDNWLRKFRKSYLKDWNYSSVPELDNEQQLQSLDLVEIIQTFDPNAHILSEEEIAILDNEEEQMLKEKYDKSIEKFPPFPKAKSKLNRKRSFKETLENYYGIQSKDNSNEEVDTVDLSQDDDDDECLDLDSLSSVPEVVSEPIVETYQQALEHLKPLEDFVLRQENFRAIGLLSTLEIIFKDHRP